MDYEINRNWTIKPWIHEKTKNFQKHDILKGQIKQMTVYPKYNV